jgi:ubiquinol-cytochrome c reductase iron-sulfur subunit
MNAAAIGGGSDHATGGQRRDFLFLAAGAFGAVGTALALWPFLHSMNPAADVLALATTEADLAPIALGQRITVQWRGQPVFIEHRTPQQIAAARADDAATLRDPEPDAKRAPRPEWLIIVGVCTHLGCIPLGQKTTDPRGEWRGWFCPCHGSHYDASGRIRKGPAPRNLAVPPYRFINDATIRIG